MATFRAPPPSLAALLAASPTLLLLMAALARHLLVMLARIWVLGPLPHKIQAMLQSLAVRSPASPTLRIISRTGAGTVSSRTITAGTGISVSNGDGVSGNPTITNTVVPNDATITLSAGTDLTGGGNFTTDQSGNETITFNHADTSTLSGTYGSTADGTKIDTITVDARGHVTAVATGTTGDILGVSAGTGLSGGGTSGTVTVNGVTQSTATWEAGTSTTEGVVTPAKVKAAIDALGGGGEYLGSLTTNGASSYSLTGLDLTNKSFMLVSFDGCRHGVLGEQNILLEGQGLDTSNFLFQNTSFYGMVFICLRSGHQRIIGSHAQAIDRFVDNRAITTVDTAVSVALTNGTSFTGGVVYFSAY